MTHCPGCTGEAQASHSTYGHILGCGSTKEGAGLDHDHHHEKPGGKESPLGDGPVQLVLTEAARDLSKKAKGKELTWEDVAKSLRYAFGIAWPG